MWKGKSFFGILARRLITFTLDNEYIDTSVQKAFVPRVPGCLKHTSVISKVIKYVKRNHCDLTVLWVYLTNPCGTVPHKVMEITLKTYHVTEQFQKPLGCYFDKFNMHFTCRNFITEW